MRRLLSRCSSGWAVQTAKGMHRALRLQPLASVRLENSFRNEELKRSKRRRTLVFQATSKVSHDHPCVDKGYDEKNDGDDSCDDVRITMN